MRPARLHGLRFPGHRKSAEIGLCHALALQQLDSHALRYDASGVEDIAAVGDLQRRTSVLLDEQDCQAPLLQHHQAFEYLYDHPGRHPQRGLVQYQETGRVHECAPNREDLPFAATERSGELVPALAQQGENLEHLFDQPVGIADVMIGARDSRQPSLESADLRIAAKLQVVEDAQRAE